MTTKNYHRTLFEAKQDLARCLVKRQKIDHKVARLQAVISDLENLCAELDQKGFEKRVERVIKADLTVGITESARVILRDKFFPMTASELTESIEARKHNLSTYSNPLAVIHTVLKRLVQSGEVRMVPQAKGKKAYQWVSPTDKLLSELRLTGSIHATDHWLRRPCRHGRWCRTLSNVQPRHSRATLDAEVPQLRQRSSL